MAEKATLNSILANQKKFLERLSFIERNMKGIFHSYCQLVRTQIPVKLQKLAKEWEDYDIDDDDVTIKSPKAKTVSGNTFYYLFYFVTK